jgi:hypothetical protein
VSRSGVVLLLAAMLAQYGCAVPRPKTDPGARAEVEQAPDGDKRYAQVTVAAPDVNPAVPEQVATYLNYRMCERIYRDRIFSPGPELTMRYAVVQYNPGNREARERVMGMDGTGSIVIEAIYTDAGGTVVGRIRSTGVVTGAPGQNSGMQRAVQDAVDRTFDTMLELYH